MNNRCRMIWSQVWPQRRRRRRTVSRLRVRVVVEKFVQIFAKIVQKFERMIVERYDDRQSNHQVQIKIVRVEHLDRNS